MLAGSVDVGGVEEVDVDLGVVVDVVDVDVVDVVDVVEVVVEVVEVVEVDVEVDVVVSQMGWLVSKQKY